MVTNFDTAALALTETIAKAAKVAGYSVTLVDIDRTNEWVSLTFESGLGQWDYDSTMDTFQTTISDESDPQFAVVTMTNSVGEFRWDG